MPAKNPHAVALGKLGGKQKTERKAKSARENGKKGGRPKREHYECNTCLGDVWEYPYLVLDKAALRCERCKQEHP